MSELLEVSISIIKSYMVGFISYEMTEHINFTRLHKHEINPAQNDQLKQANYQERNVDSVKVSSSNILINFVNQKIVAIFLKHLKPLEQSEHISLPHFTAFDTSQRIVKMESWFTFNP
jgi:hypothetical protein